jgi:hypothetical protein
MERSMLKPTNYVNLYDFIYPEVALPGLADDSQINTAELNARLAIVRGNHRSLVNAMSGIVTQADAGNYFKEYMKPFSEVVAASRFTLTALQITNAQFDPTFDVSGAGPFGEARTVFQLRELGGELANDVLYSATVSSSAAASQAGIVFLNADAAPLSVGMAAFGTNIPPGTTVETIAVGGSYTTVTLSANILSTGVLSGAPISFALPPPVLVFSGGLLVQGSDYVVRTVQGGAVLYLKTSSVTHDVPVDVVLMRTFNQKGVTWGNSALGWSAYTHTYGGGGQAGPLTLSVDSLSLRCGNVFDLSTYAIFRKAAADNYYRHVDDGLVASRVPDVGDDGAVFTVDTDALGGETFMVIGRSSYWEYNWSGTPDATTSAQFSIPLLEQDGATPAPVGTAYDVDVWLDGRLLRPEYDYTVQTGSPDDITQPPRILVGGMTIGTAHWIRAVSNAPYDAAHSVQVYGAVLSDTRGLVLVSASGRQVRLTDGVGMLYSGGYFDGYGMVNTVGENRGLDVSSLTARTDYTYRARYCLTKDALEMCESSMSLSTGMDKFLDLFGSVDTDLAISSYDYQSAYAVSHSLASGHVPATSRPAWYSPFGPGYFWVRDRIQAGASSPRVSSSLSLSFDCRVGRGIFFTPTADYPDMASWGEPPLAPGAGGVSVDCRPLQAGYTPVDLDFRPR